MNLHKLYFYIKHLNGLFLNVVLFIFSWLVPKKNGLILFGGGLGEHFSGNPRYYFLYLHHLYLKHEYPFRQHIWITKSSSVLNTLKQKNLPVQNAYTIKAFWMILRAEYLIIESAPALKKGGHDIAYQRFFMGNFKVVQTWHGSPAKRILLDALKDRRLKHWYEKIYFNIERMELQNIWCILAMGEREKTILSSAFMNNRVHILGYPKNDILLSGQVKKSALLNAYDRIILYAPTFREHENALPPFSVDFLYKLNFEMKNRNWIFLIKKHPYEKVLTVPSNLENVIDVTTMYEDIQILLSQIDLLITDYSSVYIDFLLTQKPILFYVYDYDDYRLNTRNFYYDFLENAPGFVAYFENDLLQYILEQNITKRIKRNYNYALKIFHKYIDADSSKRLTAFLLVNQKG